MPIPQHAKPDATAAGGGQPPGDRTELPPLIAQFTRRPGSALLLACLLALTALAVWSTSAGEGSRSKLGPAELRQRTSEVFLIINVLKDLDRGDVKSARQRLADDCMFQLVAVLDGLDFTTNRDALLGQPALRAAARYWGGKPLPVTAESMIFTPGNPTLSNGLYQALEAVRSEYDRKASPPKAGK